MTIFTAAELEFLTRLNTRWGTLYRNELARLFREACNRADGPRLLDGPGLYPGVANSEATHLR